MKMKQEKENILLYQGFSQSDRKSILASGFYSCDRKFNLVVEVSYLWPVNFAQDLISQKFQQWFRINLVDRLL